MPKSPPSGYSNPSSLDATSLRVDHAINSKLNLFGRYNYSPSSFAQRAPPVSTQRRRTRLRLIKFQESVNPVNARHRSQMSEKSPIR